MRLCDLLCMGKCFCVCESSKVSDFAFRSVTVRAFVQFHSLCSCERLMICPSCIVKLQYWPLPDFFVSSYLSILLSLSFLLFFHVFSCQSFCPSIPLQPFFIFFPSSIPLILSTFTSPPLLSFPFFSVLHLSCLCVTTPSSLLLMLTNIERDVFFFSIDQASRFSHCVLELSNKSHCYSTERNNKTSQC